MLDFLRQLRANGLVARIAASAALGGFLFGYDTGVISGALLFIKKDLSAGPATQEYIVSAILIGAMGGAVLSGYLADRISRRNTKILSGCFYFVAALGCALSVNSGMLIGFRFLLGLSVGTASFVSPMYISEVAPPAIRGGLTSFNQLAITTGILVSYLVNFAFSGTPQGWRWMLGIAAVPGAALAIGMLTVPKTPRWLTEHGRQDEARAVLAQVRPNAPDRERDDELTGIERSVQESSGLRRRDLLHRQYRPLLILGLSLAIFQQLVGVDTVIYYAPTILQATGLTASGAIAQTVAVGVTNVVVTVVAVLLLDRVGRRPLLLTGAGLLTVGELDGELCGLGHLPEPGRGDRPADHVRAVRGAGPGRAALLPAPGAGDPGQVAGAAPGRAGPATGRGRAPSGARPARGRWGGLTPARRRPGRGPGRTQRPGRRFGLSGMTPRLPLLHPSARTDRTDRTGGNRRALVRPVAILAIALTGLLPLGAQAAPPPDRSAAPQPYLVTLTAAPAATYQGGVAGMAATQAATGQRLQVQAAAVARYRTFLGAEQARVARSVGATPSADYTLALNGFAARLTPAQAARLAATPGVRSVTRSVRYHPAVYGTPDLLGLTGSGGVWAGLGGPAAAGKGVVVGVLDTGIWPENPMFAGPAVTATAPSGVGSSYRAPDGRIHVVKANGTEFVGSCQQGASFPASTCTSKLVGARFFDAGFLATVPADHLGAHEFLSPRDGDSHGSHTASTAAGDPVASMTVGGRTFQGGSGMAPAAKIAAYKVCWSADDPMFDGCVDTDIIAGIEAAIGDGVDVINFSLGGPAAGPGDPLLLALMNAAAAGVFVAAAGGNSGPGAATVDNASPWLTTVAATTAHRYDATVRLGNGRTYRGVQFATTDLPATPVVLGKSVAATGADPSDATQCLPDTLSPAKVAHRIVVCDRGITPRMEKANEVKRAGGAGMILANGADEGLIPDDYPLPAVHLSVADSTAVRAYVLGSRNPTAALLSGDRTGRAATPVPVVAGFSSRGPAKVGGGDLVKPDLAAPGVGIVAAVASDANPRGDSYGVESGTSMATPHIAGLAALIRGRHPEWTPMAVKSAMMTTATDTRTDTGGRQTDPFAQGAGFVNPRRFLTPGLVYDSNVSDWQAYLKGAGVDTGSGARPIAAVDLNVPSIGIGALVGSRIVTRTVTAVTAGTYTAAVSLPGFRVTVTPSTLVLARPGQRATFRVTLTRTTAPLDRYATGLLTWSARTGGLTVRSPIAVRPVPLAAPAELHAAATARSISYRITPGATGTVRISRAGLVAGTVKAGIVTVGPANPGRSGDAANKVFRITVPSGTTLTRFEARTAKPGQRLDLYLLDTVGNSIEDTTGSPTPGLLDRINPIDGTYYLVVNGASNPGGGPISFSLRVFNLGTARPTLTVTPNPVAARQGTPTAVRLNWPALRPRTPYLGTVTYSTSDLRTVITIG